MDNDELNALNMAIAKSKGMHFYEIQCNGVIVACSCASEERHGDTLLHPNHNEVMWGNGVEVIGTDWARDIAAAYALEDEIPEDQRRAYQQCLLKEFRRGPVGEYSLWNILHASPAQRCRAYLARKGAK